MRDYLERDLAVLNVALHIFLTAIEWVLRPHSPGASAASRLGAAIFIPLDAQVRIEAHERDGLERLLRYGARPAFALERLREINPDHLVHESVKPRPGGNVSLMLTPMQLLDRLAALIPPPRKHRHRYHGVLAPNSPLREAVTAPVQPTELAAAPTRIESIRPDAAPAEPLHRQADQRIAWWDTRRTEPLVGGDSCLYSPGRRTSAARLTTGADNGHSGAGFHGRSGILGTKFTIDTDGNGRDTFQE